MASFTPSGSGGIPLNVSTTEITSYSVVNVSVPTANIEVSIAVPSDVVWLQIYNRTTGLTKLAFAVGESGTNYSTLNPGDAHTYTKTSGASLTLYVQCPKAGQVLEITYGHA